MREDARVSTLADAVRAELAARANPEKAPDMQAYMKSAMPYYGVIRGHELSGLSRREALKNTAAGRARSAARASASAHSRGPAA
jgi:hypothetical protein